MTDGLILTDERVETVPCQRRERAYQRLLKRYYRFLVPPGQRVLELGCAHGDLLAALNPGRGVGVDTDAVAVNEARQRYPHLEFRVADAAEFETHEKFDYVILSDLVNSVPDVQKLLDHLHRHSFQHTRLVVNSFNNLWRPMVALARLFGSKGAQVPENWLSLADLKNLLHLAGWELIKTDAHILWPYNASLLNPLFNRWLAPVAKHFCLTVFVVARPRPLPHCYRSCRCSVVIPARNEAGNIETAIQRTPDMGDGTEIIFVEGGSNDHTWDEIQRVIAKYPERDIKALKQTGQGKGDAVRSGFAAATGDLLFILDADLTVPPEDLPKFYHIALTGTADFVNGVRLVYPMENEAMRFLNMVANKFFGLAFSWLLGQPVKDTLCGTKVLFREHYDLIVRNRAYFGDFDPFGDFDLLFGAAKLNLRIIDLPIRYRARTYGETNISRWKHGWLLLRMVSFAAKRLKFCA